MTPVGRFLFQQCIYNFALSSLYSFPSKNMPTCLATNSAYWYRNPCPACGYITNCAPGIIWAISQLLLEGIRTSLSPFSTKTGIFSSANRSQALRGLYLLHSPYVSSWRLAPVSLSASSNICGSPATLRSWIRFQYAFAAARPMLSSGKNEYAKLYSTSSGVIAVARTLRGSVGGFSRGQTMAGTNFTASSGTEVDDPAMMSLRTSFGAVRATICTAAPPMEKPKRSI